MHKLIQMWLCSFFDGWVNFFAACLLQMLCFYGLLRYFWLLSKSLIVFNIRQKLKQWVQLRRDFFSNLILFHKRLLLWTFFLVVFSDEIFVSYEHNNDLKRYLDKYFSLLFSMISTEINSGLNCYPSWVSLMHRKNVTKNAQSEPLQVWKLPKIKLVNGLVK